jgi:hypothetical protein
MRKLLMVILIANACLWAYFWLAFAHASQPYDPRPWGHPPVDPYCFWGHAIGLTTSSLTYPFMKVAFWVEFPAFLAVALFRKAFLSGVSGDTFFAGVSIGGYELIATMLLSFLQWLIFAWTARKLLAWISRRPVATP